MPLPQGGRPLRGANAGWWSLHFAFHHTARSVTATTSRRVFTTASQRCVSGQRPVHADAATFPHCFIRHTPSALYSRMAAAITATIITMAPTMNQFLPILRVLTPDSPAVADRVRLSVLSTEFLFPVGFPQVQPWSSPVPSGRLSFVVSCSLRRSPVLIDPGAKHFWTL